MLRQRPSQSLPKFLNGRGQSGMAVRPLGRVGILFVVVLSIFFLSQSLEQRKYAYTCRSLKDCMGFGTGTVYKHRLDHEPTIEETERTLNDGTVRYDRVIPDANPKLLFLVLNRDARSWSRDFNSGRRSSYDFLDTLVKTELNMTETSLSMLTASEEEYSHLKESTQTLPFGRVTIMLRHDTGPNIPYLDRHKPELQLPRRSHIAKMRNYHQSRSLNDEEHILWVDADVVEFSPGIVQKMIYHSNTNSSVGMLTARCQHNHIYNYDKNSWVVDRTVPNITVAVPEDKRNEMVDKLDRTRTYIVEATVDTKDDDIRWLDAVGGTILYIRADLIRHGVHFPYINIVGTTWDDQGWTGVETEGICYMSRTLAGGGCYAMGGSHHVRHSDIG